MKFELPIGQGYCEKHHCTYQVLSDGGCSLCRLKRELPKLTKEIQKVMSNPKDLPLGWMHKIQFEKLSSPKNIVKESWLNCEFAQLLRRLDDEVKELNDVFYSQGDILDGEWYSQMIDECADIANFATMIAHLAKVKRNKG